MEVVKSMLSSRALFIAIVVNVLIVLQSIEVI